MSLVNRLLWFFLLTFALLIAAFSLTLFSLSRDHLYRDLDEHLVAVLDQLAATAEVDPGTVRWSTGTFKAVSSLHPEKETPSWAVLDADGKLVESSGNLAPADLSRIAKTVPGSGHDHSVFTSSAGARWRLATRRLAPGSDQGPEPPAMREVDEEEEDEEDRPENRSAGKNVGPSAQSRPLILVVGSSLAPIDSSLRLLAAFLVAGSAGSWLLSAILSRIACRRALRPMVQMASAARSMTASSRGRHLPSPGTRDDLEDLGLAFNGLIDRLHEAIHRQEQFAGDASHQLRTPLTALIGEIDVARRRDRSPEDYREILDDLHLEAIGLAQIVESLLFLARVDTESAGPSLVPIDLRRWLDDRLESDWSRLDREVKVSIDPGSGPEILVNVHPTLLTQLVDNLVENACKYSEVGRSVEVHLSTDGKRVALAVLDRGIGLSAVDRKQVFQPFFRGEQARKLGKPGVGLGLAVARRIAEAFGGTIGVDPRPGGGSAFRIELPASSTDPESEPGPRSSSRRPGVSI